MSSSSASTSSCSTSCSSPSSAPSSCASAGPSRRSSPPTKPSRSAAPEPTPAFDPYYGHEATATTAARFIIALFSCPEYAPPSNNTTRRPSLAHFIAYALHRTRLPSCATTGSLLLLSRLKQRFPSAKGSSGHRLFLSAFMTASKQLIDETYSSKSWAIVGQDLFSLSEVNRMEREFLSYLEWNCNTVAEDLLALEHALAAHYGPNAGRRASHALVPNPFVPAPEPIYYEEHVASHSHSHSHSDASPTSSHATSDDEDESYDAIAAAYPSPPSSLHALSYTSSSNHSSPSAPNTPPSVYTLPSMEAASKYSHHTSNDSDEISITRSW